MISGQVVFRLMDTHGLPLDLINEELRSKNLSFNVVEFVEVALASKNFTYEKIKGRLVEAMLPDKRETFVAELDSWFAKGGKQWQ